MVSSSLGNPACWAGGLNFISCCTVQWFGSGGNPDCWRPEFGTNFSYCCLDEGADEEERWAATNARLAAAQDSFHSAVLSLAEMTHRIDVERSWFRRARPLRSWEVEELAGLGELVRQWRSWHLTELAANLAEVLAGYEAEHRRHGASPSSPRIAILMACTPDSVGSEVCQLGANLWQCYAHHHGYHFVFDTTPFPAVPKYRFPGDAPFGLEALDADFGTEYLRMLEEEPVAMLAGTDGAAFKWWQRWYAARRHLRDFDLLLVVDPDTAVFPTCMGVDLPTALGLPADMADWPGVMARDPRDGEDLNGGVFALTGKPWGRLYLELLLARSRWPLDVAGGGGWCHARQSAEYETLLEVIVLDQMVASEGLLEYASECMKHAVPQLVMQPGEEPTMGCIWPAYLKCWRKVTNRLLGPQGKRKVRPAAGARLVDPAKSDINYRPWSNEPRYRKAHRDAEEPPHVRNAAFLWHYVAIPNKTASMMRDFGMGSLQEAFDCRNLTRRWVGAERDGGPRGAPGAGPGGRPLPVCKLAGSDAACPFEDADLMPHQFGC